MAIGAAKETRWGISGYKSLGEYPKAIEFYGQQLEIGREIGDRTGEANALFNMGLALYTLGERTQAISHAEAALKILEQIESPYAQRVGETLAEWREDKGWKNE